MNPLCNLRLRSRFAAAVVLLSGVFHPGQGQLWAGTAQTIVFNEIEPKITTDEPFTVSTIASSGLPVTLEVVGSGGVATVAGNTVTLTGSAGSVTLRATQPGDASYDPAPPVFRSFVVGLASQRFVKIAAGYAYGLGIRADGSLWAWGGNGDGELGLGDNNDRSEPTQVQPGTSWQQVAGAGAYGSIIRNHSLAIRSDGTLWAWGNNDLGQLGLGSNTDQNMPQQVGSASDWTAVACGYHYSLAIRSNGTLWAWGFNSNGQLGLGSNTDQNTPQQVGSASNWTAVAGGFFHSLALRSNGTLWAWGYNYHGQLGLGSNTSQNTPQQVGNASNWTAVAAGEAHSLALRSNGTLWAWGYNYNGQLGLGSNTSQNTPQQVGNASNWTAVAGGYRLSLAIRGNGTLWAWGRDPYGQFGSGTGNGDGTNQTTPRQVGSASDWTAVADGGSAATQTLALRNNGTLWVWGFGHIDSELGKKPGRIPQDIGWQFADGGLTHTVAVAADGTLWTWGENGSGQLGLGSDMNATQYFPRRVGEANNWAASVGCGVYHSAALRSDGSLWTWGSNAAGKLGLGGGGSRNTPTQVLPGSIWTQVSTGHSHTAAIRTDGSLWTWGANVYGELGLGDTGSRNSPVQVQPGSLWKRVACGYAYTLAIRQDGTLWAWGRNDAGQLGLGSMDSHDLPQQVGSFADWTWVDSGAEHAAGLRADGSLWTWGDGQYGRLGQGDTANCLSPVQVGLDTDWRMVACGRSHTNAIRRNGTLWSWGRNNGGQLGMGDNIERHSPEQAGTHSTWTFIGAGDNSAFGIRAGGRLFTWGSITLGRSVWPRPGRVWPRRSAQTLSFPAAATLFQGQNYPLSASASSGLPVSYAVTAGTADLNGSLLQPLDPGSLTVRADQHGDDAWEEALPSLFHTFNINPAPAIAVTGKGQPIANGSSSTSLADNTHFGQVQLLNTTVTRLFQVHNNGGHALNMGIPSTVLEGPDAADFSIFNYPIGGPPGVASTLSISFNPRLPGLRSATVRIFSNDPDDPEYTFAISGYGVLPKPLAQKIHFTPPAVAYVGNLTFLQATSSSGLPVSFSLAAGSVPALLIDNMLMAYGPGKIKITASQPGDGLYAPAKSVTRTLLIKPAPAALALDQLTQVYDGTAKAVSALGSPDPVTVTYKYDGSYQATPPTAAGRYPVLASSGGVNIKGALVIQKAPLHVIPDDQRMFSGQTPPPLTFSYQGFVNGETPAVLLSEPVIQSQVTAKTPGGLYPITASKGKAANYLLIHHRATLVVESFTGAWEALLRDSMASSASAKLIIKVDKTGAAFSASLIDSAIAKPIAFKGALNLNLANEVADFAGTFSYPDGTDYDIHFWLYMNGEMSANTFNPDGGKDSEFGHRLYVPPHKKYKAPYAGAHTAFFDSQNPDPVTPDYPVGSGWASAVIRGNGALALAGRLADGTPFTASLPADYRETPGYRLLIQPYKKPKRLNSYISGYFRLQPHPFQPGRLYLPNGGIGWRKEGQPKDASHRLGFDYWSTLRIDPWLPASRYLSLGFHLGLAESGNIYASFNDSGSPVQVELPSGLQLSSKNKLSVLTPAANSTRWKAKLNPKNGTFSGSFELAEPGGKRKASFSGILRQPISVIDGLSGGGYFLLNPAPGSATTEKETGGFVLTRYP